MADKIRSGEVVPGTNYRVDADVAELLNDLLECSSDFISANLALLKVSLIPVNGGVREGDFTVLEILQAFGFFK